MSATTEIVGTCNANAMGVCEHSERAYAIFMLSYFGGLLLILLIGGAVAMWLEMRGLDDLQRLGRKTAEWARRR